MSQLGLSGLRWLVSLVAVCCLVAAARADSGCGWSTDFGAPGADTGPDVMARAAIGGEDLLFVGRNGLQTVNGLSVDGLAAWDGAAWRAIGAPDPERRIDLLIGFNDGTAEALYAFGRFEKVGGSETQTMARWDGATWTYIPTDLDPSDAYFESAAVFDDGTGPALFLGGVFRFYADPQSYGTHTILRWDGSSLTSIAENDPSGVVGALCVYDDGAGPALYACGLNLGDGEGMYRYDGTWSGFLGGFPGGIGVRTTTVFDDGTGAKLYAAGDFTGISLDGASAPIADTRNIACWDGAQWSPVSPVTGPGSVTTVGSFGGDLWIGGSFSFTNDLGELVRSLARLDGSRWASPAHFESGAIVSVLQTFDVGGAPALVLAGGFEEIDGSLHRNIAAWTGSAMAPVGHEPAHGCAPITPGAAHWLSVVFHVGAAEHLVVSGSFTSAGDVLAPGVADWDGTSWTSIGADLGVVSVDAMCRGSGAGGIGEAVYLWAYLESPPSGQPGFRALRWDGSALTEVAGHWGNGPITSIAWFDDGSGPTAYIAGRVRFYSGGASYGVLKWNGATWELLTSVTDPSMHVAGMTGGVGDLAVFDDGSGSHLYVFGSLGDVDETPLPGIAEWSGTEWTDPLPSVSRTVADLITEDQLNGANALYFWTGAPGETPRLFRRTPVGTIELVILPDGTVPETMALATHTSPPHLYATTGDTIWEQRGSAPWRRLNQDTVRVNRLEVLDDGPGARLYALGNFERIGDVYSSGVGAWPVDQPFLDFTGTPDEGRVPFTSPHRMFTLTAGAVGDGPVAYQWLFQPVPLTGPAGPVMELHDGANVSGATSETLTISNTDWASRGYYTVRVSDACETIESATYMDVRCASDLNGDHAADVSDFNRFVAEFGTASGAQPADGDLDFDGDVDIFDFGLFAEGLGCVRQ